MAYSSTFLIVAIALLSLFSLSSSIQEESVHRAAEILSDSGYVSMSLTLQLLYPALISNASTATIFSPSDDAFSNSGQPSFALLQIHFSPVAYSFAELQLLPFGSKIPTLSPGRMLTVTTRPSDNGTSIDNVRVDGSPIYNDGLLVVYTADSFFDLDFKILTPAPSPSLETAPFTQAPSPFVRTEPSFAPVLSPDLERALFSPVSSPSLETAPFIQAPSPIVRNEPSSAPVLSPDLERALFSPVSSPRLDVDELSPVCSPNLECPVYTGARSFTEGGKSMKSESLLYSLVCIMVIDSLFLGFRG